MVCDESNNVAYIDQSLLPLYSDQSKCQNFRNLTQQLSWPNILIRSGQVTYTAILW
jgi:hypothetical protein